jgi:hypothetical protein
VAFNSGAVLDRLKTICDGLSVNGLTPQVTVGAPEYVEQRISIYITVGSQPIQDVAGGLIQRDGTYFIGFAYRVATAEEAAERALAEFLDEFSMAFYADRAAGFGGAAESGAIDFSLADEPQYEVNASTEFRVYPVIARFKQSANI